MTQKPPTRFEMVKFFVGVVLFVGLIGVHSWVKELPIFLLASPFVIMGVDLQKLLSIGGKK